LSPRAALMLSRLEGHWVKARGLKDRNPFTQPVVRQAVNVQLQSLPASFSTGSGSFYPGLKWPGPKFCQGLLSTGATLTLYKNASSSPRFLL